MRIIKKASKIIFTTKMIILIIFFASTVYAELKLDSVYPTLGELGKDLEVILTGEQLRCKYKGFYVSGFWQQRCNHRHRGYTGIRIWGRGGWHYSLRGGLLESGLQVIDVSTPSSPQIIGSVDYAGMGLQMSRSLALWPTWRIGTSGLQVVDVSNPASPQIIGSMDTPGEAWGVTVVGSTAYVADYVSGLQVIDVGTPASPQIIGSVDTPGEARGVTVVGTTAYVADNDSGLQVIDVSTPASPQIIGSVATPGYA